MSATFVHRTQPLSVDQLRTVQQYLHSTDSDATTTTSTTSLSERLRTRSSEESGDGEENEDQEEWAGDWALTDDEEDAFDETNAEFRWDLDSFEG